MSAKNFASIKASMFQAVLTVPVVLSAFYLVVSFVTG